MSEGNDKSSSRPESGPVGSRTEKPHSPTGWDLGGRKEDSTFDPALAQEHAERNK
jgi:hypothetical protein